RFVAAPRAAPAQQVLRLDVMPGTRPAGAGPGSLWSPASSGDAPDVAVGGEGRPPATGHAVDGRGSPPVEDASREELERSLAAAVARADAIVLADYGLSDLTVDLWPRVRHLAGSRPV